MKRFLASFSRITVRAGLLAAALFLALVFWYLPNFLNLDAFRPQLIDLLERTFHCTVLVGNVQGELFPYPGLVVGHVVFLEPSKTPRVLAAVQSVHVWIATKPLLKRQLRFQSIRFSRPRFILHQENGREGAVRWTTLALPHVDSTDDKSDVDLWEIRNGSLEIWDHTQEPTAKWVIDRLNGSFQARTQRGAMAGHAPGFGARGLVDIHFSAPPNVSGAWMWDMTGKDFVLDGTDFSIPKWSAAGDSRKLSVRASASTPQGGAADVFLTRPMKTKDMTLDVHVRAVTIRQVLEVFHLQSKGNPYGYEPWRVTEGSLHSILRPGVSFDVNESSFDIEGMHLEMAGSFALGQHPPQAHLDGRLENIPVEKVVDDFFTPPSPITGTGQATFSLTFPLSAKWLEGLSGPLEVRVDQGVLRVLKSMYRIVSVLNLGNYLRLRLPRVAAEGIVFQNITGHMIFQNGVLSSEDLFLKSPDMNVGAKGAVDIPQKRVKTTLRVEMLRFLEDIFRVVPITHWIFKKPNKILFPLVVSVEGPWDDAEVK